MAQFAYPSGDVSATNWTGSYTAIDEGATPNDGDFVYSQDNPSSTDYFEVTLGSLTDPLSSTGHVLRWRHVLIDGGAVASDAGTGCDLDVYLRQGTTTTIASKLTIVLDAVLSWAPDSITLSAGEADSITDYTALRFRAGAQGGGGSPANRRGAGISWVELEVPTASNDRIAQISAFEFETPNAPRRAQISAYEFEVPEGPRTYSGDFYEVSLDSGQPQYTFSATTPTTVTGMTVTPASGDYLAIFSFEFSPDAATNERVHFGIAQAGTLVEESKLTFEDESSYEPTNTYGLWTFGKVSVNGSQAVTGVAWITAVETGTHKINARSLFLIPLAGKTYGYFGIGHEDNSAVTNIDLSDGLLDLHNGFAWFSHGSGVYSLRDTDGTSAPTISGKPPAIRETTLGILTEGTLGSLNDHEWAWGDNHSLGFDTIYFRDDTGDPDVSGVSLRVCYVAPATGDYLVLAHGSADPPTTVGTPAEMMTLAVNVNGTEDGAFRRVWEHHASFPGSAVPLFTSGVVPVTSGNYVEPRYGSTQASGTGSQTRIRGAMFVMDAGTSGTDYWREDDGYSTTDTTTSATKIDIDDDAGTDWSQSVSAGHRLAIFSATNYNNTAGTAVSNFGWMTDGTEYDSTFYSRRWEQEASYDGNEENVTGMVARLNLASTTDVAVGWDVNTGTSTVAGRTMVVLALGGGSDRKAQISAFEFEVPNAPRKAQISAYEFEVPTAPRRAQISAYELEVPTAPRKAQISAYEFEVPNAPRRAQISAYEFEVETPKRAQISAFEFEVPNAPRRAQISAYELEVPTAPRRAQISAYEFEVPTAPRKAQISAFEFEIPQADRKAQISAFEFETPNADRKAQISAYEFEVPTAPRKAQISAYEFELPNAPRRAQISAFEFETPNADRKAQISAYELELPDPPTRWAMISAFEFEVPNAPRRAQISAYEFEVPTAPRRANISAFELEVPTAPRRAQVSAFELEVPTAPRKANVSAFELEMGDAARTAMISAFELEVPTASRFAQISAYEFETGNPPRRAMVSAFELQLPSVGAPEAGPRWRHLGIGIWNQL